MLPGISGFPKIRSTLLRVPIRRVIVHGGLDWGPPILGNDHVWASGMRLSVLHFNEGVLLESPVLKGRCRFPQ